MMMNKSITYFFLSMSVIFIVYYILNLCLEKNIINIQNDQQKSLNLIDYEQVGSSRLSRIRLQDKWFIDDANRVVLLRGVNAVKKSFPWIPNTKNDQVDLTNKTQLENLKLWGFNVLRLGVMWTGVMPAKNQINQTYLNEISDIIDRLAYYGIYVIIDMHQDMMSSKFGSYDGVPLWVMNELPKSNSDFPWPLKDSALNVSLFSAYLSEACSFAFQCLYDNVNNFGDYFQQYWSIVSNEFSSKKSVLGYEILNEPWAGDIYANPLLLLPGIAGHFNLMKLYDKTYETISKYDNDSLIFYEPVTWGVLFNANYFGSGFLRPPGNDKSRTVFTWHYYCWFLQFTKNPLVNGTYPMFEKIFCDKFQLDASFEAVQVDLFILGSGPSFLSEFGVCSFYDEDNKKLNVEECEAVLDTNDKYFTSWTYWDSNFYSDDKKKVNYDLIKIFSRVYPIATNGIPKLLHFNTTTKRFAFTFQLNITSLNQTKYPTEIYIPPHVYPHGFEVTIQYNFKWSYNPQRNVLLINLADHLIRKLKYSEFVFFDLCKLIIRPVKI